MTDRLYRSPTDRVVAGVAGGLAVWLNVDPSLVRIGWILLAILSGGIFVLVYLVMAVVVPLPPQGWMPHRPAPGPQPGWTGGWTSPPPPGGTGGWSSPPPPAPDWTSPVSGHNAGIVLGLLLIALGAWFLVDEYVHVDPGLVWPGIVIVLGVALIAGALRRGQSGRGG